MNLRSQYSSGNIISRGKELLYLAEPSRLPIGKVDICLGPLILRGPRPHLLINTKNDILTTYRGLKMKIVSISIFQSNSKEIKLPTIFLSYQIKLFLGALIEYLLNGWAPIIFTHYIFAHNIEIKKDKKNWA